LDVLFPLGRANETAAWLEIISFPPAVFNVVTGSNDFLALEEVSLGIDLIAFTRSTKQAKAGRMPSAVWNKGYDAHNDR